MITEASPLPTQVVMADDHAMIRESLARVLEAAGTVKVVGQASDGQELVEAVRARRPACVITDYSMPHMDAPKVIESLVSENPDVKVLVLTVHENVHYAVRALEAGAHGYMIKSSAVEELVDAIATVANGEIYISPKVSADVWNRLRRPKRHRLGLDALSQREFDALRILGSGASLQDCAKEMNVSTSTVSTYRTRILNKLNLNTTAELIRFAIEHNING